jgi:hypothetical protein
MTGFVVGIVTSLPDAIITKAYVPIMATGVVFGWVAVTVPAASRPVTVSSAVTAKPGLYAFTISLEALEAGTTRPQRIAPEVSVTVR